METANGSRGLRKGKSIPYGTFTLDEKDRCLRYNYYYYGYRRDDDLPPLPCVEPELLVSNPEETVFKGELMGVVSTLLSKLPRRESTILKMRFGLEGSCEYSRAEVGKAFDISEVRVGQLEVRALQRLKYPYPLKDKQWLKQIQFAINGDC